MKKHLQYMTLVSILGCCADIHPAAADPIRPVLDQEYLPAADNAGGFVHAGFGWAQTFTAGITGWLTSVDVLIQPLAGTNVDDGPFQGNVPLLYEFRPTTLGAPAAEIIFGGAIPRSEISDTPAFLSIALPSHQVQVRQGEQYALILRAFGAPNREIYLWRGDFPPRATYPGGETFVQLRENGPWFAQLNDHGFRTYVSPVPEPIPEPTTVALFGTGVALLAWRRKRRSSERADGQSGGLA